MLNGNGNKNGKKNQWSKGTVKRASKNGATCFAILLQNELNSDVARFATHDKKTLQPYSNVGGKTRNITRFNSFCSSVANKLAQVARFFVTRFTLLASH